MHFKLWLCRYKGRGFTCIQVKQEKVGRREELRDSTHGVSDTSRSRPEDSDVPEGRLLTKPRREMFGSRINDQRKLQSGRERELRGASWRLLSLCSGRSHKNTKVLRVTRDICLAKTEECWNSKLDDYGRIIAFLGQEILVIHDATGLALLRSKIVMRRARLHRHKTRDRLQRPAKLVWHQVL